MIDLQDTTLALDFRLTILEENGGGDRNSSVAELEVRVEVLEGTAADHETRISAAEIDINGKDFLKVRGLFGPADAARVSCTAETDAALRVSLCRPPVPMISQ